MGNSLQDQLLKMGIADDAQAKKIKSEKRKQTKQQRKNKVEIVDQKKLLVEKATAEKKERDRQLNQQKKVDAEQKAVVAQIKQLIETNRLLTGDEEIPYNFIENNIVKNIYVSEVIRDQIGRGKAAIVKMGDRYEVVPAAIAEKIHIRDENRVILQNDRQHDDQKEDDLYANYQIPDDLMW
ncbi:MAG: DUF2058 domain-containing protein [Rhodospirillaceae bacterium]|nr:DUF2058 domain-containing protein [Rhodospirillaceae bacterium]